MNKYINLCFIFVLSIFGLDFTSLILANKFLNQESINISSIISKAGGINQQLLEYLYDKNYDFIYYEDNSNKIGDIAYYDLILELNLILNQEKKITHTYGVILLGY